MTLLWSPDSCDCIILVDSNFNYENWIQKCFIHKNMNDIAFLNTVHIHNKNLNRPTQTRTETLTLKANEKARIRALGDPIKNV